MTKFASDAFKCSDLDQNSSEIDLLSIAKMLITLIPTSGNSMLRSI